MVQDQEQMFQYARYRKGLFTSSCVISWQSSSHFVITVCLPITASFLHYPLSSLRTEIIYVLFIIVSSALNTVLELTGTQ